MKRFFILLLCIFLPIPAMAASSGCSIQDLPDVTAPRWQQTYEVHGRTIEVDVDVRIPDVPSAPVLLVETAEPVQEPLHSRLKAAYEQAEKDDPIHSYSFTSKPFRTGIVHAFPPLWGDTRGSDFVAGAMGQNAYDLTEYELDTAYPENNVLTVAEAIAIAQGSVADLFPHEVLDVRNITIWDRSYWKQTKEPISQKGYYRMCFSQCFHGIPFMASIHSAFSLMSIGNENTWLSQRGLMRASVVDADHWSFNCCFYQEQSVLRNDIPLLPFDAVKAQVETLIQSGHVRRIDEVGLGYMQFDTDDPDTFVLLPSWVVWCEYHKGGAASEQMAGINNSGLLYENSDYYRPLIINAQTGEIIDPENEQSGRCLCPEIK